MKQKIASIGRRPAVFLPRMALREMGLQEGSAVDVRLDAEKRRIEVVPIAEPVARAEVSRFTVRVDQIIERYRRTLERLAR